MLNISAILTYMLLAVVVVSIAAVYFSSVRRLHAKGARRALLRRTQTPDDLPAPSAIAFDAVVIPDAAGANGETWHDVSTAPSGLIAFSIGTSASRATDDGAGGAAAIRSMLSEAAGSSADPAEALASVNRRMYATDRAATALVGTIDPRSLEITYAGAGHAPPVFADGIGGAAYGEPGGFALGLMPVASYRSYTRSMAPGEMAVLVTGSVGRTFVAGTREERLRKIVAVHAAAHTPSPAKPILHDALTSTPCDVTTLVAMKFVGNPEVSDGPSGRSWRLDVRDAEAATRLRRTVVACVRRNAPETDTLASEIVIGELINEILENAPGLVDVTLDWHSEPARFVVEHAGATSVADASAVSFADGGARGRYLVNVLAEGLRVSRTFEGRERVEVDLPQSGTASSARVRPNHTAAL